MNDSAIVFNGEGMRLSGLKRIIIISVCAAAAAAGLESAGRSEFVQSSVSEAACVQRYASKFFKTADQSIKGLMYFQRLQEENELLKSENIRLRSKCEKLSYLKKQNASFKELMKFNNENFGSKAIYARVSARDMHNWNCDFTLDKGRLDGVCEGMAAAVPEGVIGQVKTAGSRSCRIQTINSENSGIPVVLAKCGAFGILQTNKKKHHVIKYISYDVEVSEGECVLTSGLGNVYPEGLVVGHVIKSEAGTDSFSQDIYVSLSADFSKADAVALLKKDDASILKSVSGSKADK